MATIRLLFILITSLLLIACSENNSQSLIVLPDAGNSPVIHAINNASHNINLVIYSFTDRKIANAIIKSHNRGVKTNIIIEKAPYKNKSVNHNILSKLKKAGIVIHYGSTYYNLTHQKTLVIDNKTAYIMTGNFTYSGFRYQRNFVLIDHDLSDIKEINRAFYDDMYHKKFYPQKSNLVWSPNNSRSKLLSLLNNAHHKIDIYASDLSDQDILDALINDAHHGIDINIISTNLFKPSRTEILKSLQKQHIKIHQITKPVIHAKTIIIDPGYKDNEAFVGSINFTYPGISKNRELGIITKQDSIINKLLTTFNHDWLQSNINVT